MSFEQASGPHGQVEGSFGRWWRQADQFDWLTGYLPARGLGLPTRLLMALISGALVLMPGTRRSRPWAGCYVNPVVVPPSSAGFGGEESIVVDAVPADVAHALPGQLCSAIAALPHSVTASVGAAVVRWDSVADPASAIEELIRGADNATYTAKHNGGSQSHEYQPALA